MKKMLLWVAAITLSMVFVSCDDDKEDDPNLPVATENFYLYLTCEPSDVWYNFYDIVATYTDIHGHEVVDTLSPGHGLLYNASLPVKDKTLGDTFYCYVKATAKYSPEELNPSYKVDLVHTTFARVCQGPSPAEYSMVVQDASWKGMLAKSNAYGTLIQRFVEKYPEGYFLQMKYSR